MQPGVVQMCGIVGIVSTERNVASDLYYGGLQLQHRGKESARMVVETPGGKYLAIGGLGEFPQAFGCLSLDERGDKLPDESLHERLCEIEGRIGIVHNRYSTAGTSNRKNIQPVHDTFRGRDFYTAHNGNLVNTKILQDEVGLEKTASDTRVIAALISQYGSHTATDFETAVMRTLQKLQGAFCLLFLFDGKLIAARDAHGFHPLQLGKRDGDHLVASESCVFDHLNAEFVRDIKPGEFAVIEEGRIHFCQWTRALELKFDIFEFIYFLRPDSVVQGVRVWQARYEMGRLLAKEHLLLGCVVVPVPDSGNAAALGYYEGLPLKNFPTQFRPQALFRPHTRGRTFIEPIQEVRHHSLRLKFNVISDQIRGRRVVFVDDSIVRGNTAKHVVELARGAGAHKVLMVVSSPPYRYPDFYGIDTDRTKGELIARNVSGDVEAIRQEIGVDYLGYLSLGATIQGVLKAQRGSCFTKDSFYTGPFTGEYPSGTGD